MEPRPSLSKLPSTSAEAPEVQPGPSTLEEGGAQLDPVMSSKLCVIDDQKPKTMYHFHTQESLSQEEAVANSLTEPQVPSLRPLTKRTRKARNLEESAAAFLKQATATITMTPGVHETFGCVTASKLEHMEEAQHTICKEIILKALNKRTRGELTPQTHLCELDHTPPPPPTTPPTPQPPDPPQQHGRNVEGSVESDGLGLVWSGKKCRLL
ncbi:hypothetical protein AB205_0105460 [Aquarana catesbeiana]|uniref:Uncharacterized protein n=1 Tax=Aquarana catesbeiana TaxID=8400 RepID=A0A2G9QB52_AQUCT|nr:hypothetical protein AB205_0105460 [Aquarana catesbeiana]